MYVCLPALEIFGLDRRLLTYSFTESGDTSVSSSARMIEIGVSLLLPEEFGAGLAMAT